MVRLTDRPDIILAIYRGRLQVFKFIWIISGLLVNNKRINNNIHTKIKVNEVEKSSTFISGEFEKTKQSLKSADEDLKKLNKKMQRFPNRNRNTRNEK